MANGRITYVAKRNITAEHVSTQLVTNGDMSSSTGWTLGAGWAISGGLLTHTAGNTAAASQATVLVVGYVYNILYTVSGRTAGSVTMSAGGVADSAKSADGTYTYQATATASGFSITPTSDFDGSLDDVSILLTTIWSMDVDIIARPARFNVDKHTTFALDGVSNQTIAHSSTRGWDITLLRQTYANLTAKYFNEFISSIERGETYQIDVRGTIASPVDLTNAIMIGSPSQDEDAVGNIKISWTTRAI